MSSKEQGKARAFASYDEFMENVFDCVNRCLNGYLEGMKLLYANGQGGFKNVLYPDLEIASDSTQNQLLRFNRRYGTAAPADKGADTDDGEELESLIADVHKDDAEEDEEEEDEDELDCLRRAGRRGGSGQRV